MSVRNCCNCVAPFGLVFGVLGMASGLSALQTIMLSSILFGGASQVVFAQLWGAGVPAPVVGASVSVVNLRHALYSASIAPYLRSLPLRWRVPLAYLLTDEAYAVTIHRLKTQPASPFQHYHLLGTDNAMDMLVDHHHHRCRLARQSLNRSTWLRNPPDIHCAGGASHPRQGQSRRLRDSRGDLGCRPAPSMEKLDHRRRHWRHRGGLHRQTPDRTGCQRMIWIVMIACGLLTFATRFVMFSGLAPRRLPDWLEDALGFVPIAVLTAIIVPAVITGPEGGLFLAGNSRLPAAVIAVTVALVTRSVLATIATGLAALWCLEWLVY